MANKLGYFDDFINDLTERSGNMLTITGDTTVLTQDNYGALIGILDVMQDQVMQDLDYSDLTDRGAEVLSEDYRRLSDIKKQLALTMEVLRK
tara:strand:+ start:531 stop:806 length:276 start_codon:yes stop_codon:yes gene_type:complete